MMKIQIKANILELRLYVGVLAYIATFIGSIAFAQDVWHIPIIYIVFAILFDQMTRIIVSSPIDEKDLSEKYKITPDQLNAYVKSKRNYRIFAAGIATIIAFFMSLFNYKFGFCLVISCMAIWCFYPFYRFFFLKIPAPKMQNDKSSYGPQRNDSYNNWPNVPSFAMNRITPGTVEWHSNQNRIR